MNQVGRAKRRSKKNGRRTKIVDGDICGAPRESGASSPSTASRASSSRSVSCSGTAPRSPEEVCDEESGKKRSGKAEQQEQKRDDDDENKEPEPGPPLLLLEGAQQQQQQQELDLRPSRSIFEVRAKYHAGIIRMLQNRSEFAEGKEKEEEEEEVFSNSDEEEPPDAEERQEQVSEASAAPPAWRSKFSNSYLKFLGGWRDAFLEVEKRFPDTLLSYELNREGRVACIVVMYFDECPPKHQPPFVKGKPVKYMSGELRDGLHRSKRG